MITGNTHAASETQGIRELAAQITEAASMSMSRVGGSESTSWGEVPHGVAIVRDGSVPHHS
jgi:hypothetical protein